MGLSFSNVASILQAVAAVYQNRDAILSLVGEAPPTLEQIIEQLGHEICQDLEKIYDAMKQNTLVQEWKGIADTLNYAHSTLITLNNELATVSQDSAGNIWIKAGADQQTVSFENWCMGWTDSDGTQHHSALTRISELIGSDVIINQGLTLSSLSGIFSTTTPGSAGSLGSDAVGTWTAMLLLAKENQDVSNLSGAFKSETQYESLLRLMNYVYELVALALYVHDSALLILQNAGLNTNGHHSLFAGIAQNFGNFSNADSPWGIFASEFSSLASGNINAQAGNNQAAYTVDTNRSDYAHATNHIPYTETTYVAHGGGTTTSYPYSWAYCGDAISLQGTPYYQNCFFSSLGFVEVNPEGSPNYGFNLYLAVQGTVVQVGSNMEMTTQELYPPTSYYTDPSKWTATNEYNNSLSGVNTYEESYVSNQPVTNNNQINVITGFQIQIISNGQGAFNMALALQFGTLDVSNPLNPVVTITDSKFYPPDYTKACGIQEYYCVNQSGNHDSSTGSMRPAILTNASFCRLWNGDNALNVQAAPALYKADFMQPQNLQTVVNKLPVPQVAPAS